MTVKTVNVTSDCAAHGNVNVWCSTWLDSFIILLQTSVIHQSKEL